MLSQLKERIPTPLMQAYHYCMARFAVLWYRHPSERMIVIGVTGTKGKTTTSYFIAKAIEATGAKVGCATTALFKIADREWTNRAKMTMLGRFATQKLLRQMVDAGCRYAVVETSSQGLIQFRHIGINYDVAVFTNLTPEHIEAHGGFENYKKAKKILFSHMARSPRKIIDGRRLEKVAVLNADSPHAEAFANVPGLTRIEWFGREQPHGVTATDIRRGEWGSVFRTENLEVELNLPGAQNIENALAAVAVCKALNLPLEKAVRGIRSVDRLPGRFEKVDMGQPWTVLIDYAHEAASMTKLYETVEQMPHQRIIHVFGSAGTPRDMGRRPMLGAIAGKRADIMILTDEDPGDEESLTILEAIAKPARLDGKHEGENLFLIPDRHKAIAHAMRLAQEGDLVMITGKGNEGLMLYAKGVKVPWDETAIVKEAIQKEMNENRSS